MEVEVESWVRKRRRRRILSLGLATRQPNSYVLKETGFDDPLPTYRGRDWNITTTIGLADLLQMEEDKGVRKYLGLADGRPVKLIFGRYKSRASGETMFGSSLSLMAHFGEVDVLEARVSRCMNLQYKLQLGDVKRAWTEHRGASDRFAGHPNLFGKLWGEVVYEGSPYFSGGRMMVEVGIE